MANSYLPLRSCLLAGVATIALMVASPDSHAEGPSPALMPFGNVWLDLEGRFAWMRGTRQPWVGRLNGLDPSSSVIGLDTIRPDREYGGRIVFGMRFSSDVDMAFAYTGLYSNQKRGSVTSGKNYNGAYIAPVLGAVRYIMGNYIYGSGYVKIRREMHIGDFEVGHHVGLGSRSTARLFGGARIVSWRQKTDTQFDYFYDGAVPPDVGQTTEQHRSSFLGGGPRLGINGTVSVASLGRGEILIFGNVSGSILLGMSRTRVRTTWTLVNGALGPDLPSLADEQSEERFRVVYNAEASLAAGYRFMLGGVRATFRAGYRFDGWWNIVNTTGRASAIVASQSQGNTVPSLAGQFGSKRGYLITHGPFGGLSFEF